MNPHSEPFFPDLEIQEREQEQEAREEDIMDIIPGADDDNAVEPGESLQESSEEAASEDDDPDPPPAVNYRQREIRRPKRLTYGVLDEWLPSTGNSRASSPDASPGRREEDRACSRARTPTPTPTAPNPVGKAKKKGRASRRAPTPIGKAKKKGRASSRGCGDDWHQAGWQPNNFPFTATPGPRGAAAELDSDLPADFLTLFLTDELLQNIVDQTNLNPGECKTLLEFIRRVVKSWTVKRHVGGCEEEEVEEEEVAGVGAEGSGDLEEGRRTPRAPYNTDPESRLEGGLSRHKLKNLMPTSKKGRPARRCRVCARRRQRCGVSPVVSPCTQGSVLHLTTPS
ncbi:unnamed protein product [Boreogadus saida]